jgi:hypothetical protein
MGGSYGGQCYAFGLYFLGVAACMPLHLWLAPLEFGLLWSAVLLGLGLRLLRMGGDRAAAADGDNLETITKL